MTKGNNLYFCGKNFMEKYGNYDTLISPLFIWDKIGKKMALIQKDFGIIPDEALDAFCHSRINQVMHAFSGCFILLGIVF